MKTVLIVVAFGTKDNEAAFCKEQVEALGAKALLMDGGILGESLGRNQRYLYVSLRERCGGVKPLYKDYLYQGLRRCRRNGKCVFGVVADIGDLPAFSAASVFNGPFGPFATGSAV